MNFFSAKKKKLLQEQKNLLQTGGGRLKFLANTIGISPVIRHKPTLNYIFCKLGVVLEILPEMNNDVSDSIRHGTAELFNY